MSAGLATMPAPSRDPSFRPSASWEMLRLRAETLQRLRRFFDERGFLEVETPLLSHDAVVDIHLDPVPVTLFDDARRPDQGRRLWLQTSPEFAMKRLLAAGGERIYQICKAFRAGEQGSRHNPEFTMVEWYRVGDGLQEGINLLGELAAYLLRVDRVDQLSYEDAFAQMLGIHPHLATSEQLEQKARTLPVPPPSGSLDRDDWLHFLLATAVEPHLGAERPVILFDYPASQAALARTRRIAGTPEYEVAERFELYVRGVELANGYHELLDAEVLRAREDAANARRRADGKYEIPSGKNRLLDAMEQGLPPCSGVALGLDRLLMIMAGKSTVQDVLAFPIDRA